MSSLNRYIIRFQGSDSSFPRLAQELDELGIKLDEDYGLVALDATGEQSVGRVLATEDAVRRAEQALPVSFFPDLHVSPTDKNLE